MSFWRKKAFFCHHKGFSFCHLMKCSISQQLYCSVDVGHEGLWERDVINAFSVASTLLKTGLECRQRIVPLNAENMNWSPGDIKHNFLFFKLKYSWFITFCLFLLFSKVTQLYIHTHTQHTHTHILFYILFHSVLSQDTEYSCLKHSILKTLENIKTTEIQILQLDKKKKEREREKKNHLRICCCC